MQGTPFGEHLRRERELRGVTREEISVATRISSRFLEALEREQWEQLPGGIFNRGFIRSVARFLGLDEEKLVAEYDLAIQDRNGSLPRADAADTPSGGRLGIIAILATLGAVLAAGWFAYQHYGSGLWSWMKASPTIAVPTAKTARVATSVVPSDSKTADAPSLAPSRSGDAASASASEILELKVEAGKPAQVKVVADGKTVFSGRLSPGRAYSFRAHKSFLVSSSESSAVLLELNGQTVPPLGPPGQPGSIMLTRSDLKKVQGGPH